MAEIMYPNHPSPETPAVAPMVNKLRRVVIKEEDLPFKHFHKQETFSDPDTLFRTPRDAFYDAQNFVNILAKHGIPHRVRIERAGQGGYTFAVDLDGAKRAASGLGQPPVRKVSAAEPNAQDGHGRRVVGDRDTGPILERRMLTEEEYQQRKEDKKRHLEDTKAITDALTRPRQETPTPQGPMYAQAGSNYATDATPQKLTSSFTMGHPDPADKEFWEKFKGPFDKTQLKKFKKDWEVIPDKDVVPSRKDRLDIIEKERIKKIAAGIPQWFQITYDPNANKEAPLGEKPSLGAQMVAKHEREIKHAAKITGVDPDLIRSIIFKEESIGGYDEVFPESVIWFWG